VWWRFLCSCSCIRNTCFFFVVWLRSLFSTHRCVYPDGLSICAQGVIPIQFNSDKASKSSSRYHCAKTLQCAALCVPGVIFAAVIPGLCRWYRRGSAQVLAAAALGTWSVPCATTILPWEENRRANGAHSLSVIISAIRPSDIVGHLQKTADTWR
jgi:hypothetical protein